VKVVALALTLVTPSCAAVADFWWLGTGSGRVRTSSSGTTLVSAARVDTWREIVVSREAASCFDVEQPYMRYGSEDSRTRSPRGFSTLTTFATILEAGAVGGYLYFTCSADNCPSTYYVVPFAIDLAWGLYRSLTIGPSFALDVTVDRSADLVPADPEYRVRTPCPAGTAITLRRRDDSITIEVDAQGSYEDLPLEAFVSKPDPGRIELVEPNDARFGVCPGRCEFPTRCQLLANGEATCMGAAKYDDACISDTDCLGPSARCQALADGTGRCR
jgi:hypothetical protein